MTRHYRWTIACLGAFALAGCGQQPPPVAQAPAQVRSAAPAEARAAGEGLRTRYAWVRLRQDSYWIRPGDRTRLWLDISASKPVASYDADWYVTEGRLDRWRTDKWWEWNYWTAPERAGTYWLRVWVDIRYTDGTTDREWLNEYLRVSSRQPE